MPGPTVLTRQWLMAGAVALILAGAVLFVLFGRDTVAFDFVALTSPPGFRRVVLEGQSAAFDPLVGAADTGAPAARAPSVVTGDICTALYADPSSPVTGNPGAAVSIASFSDYRCPYCRVLSGILAEIAETGAARIVHKEWPIFGQPSALGARAALAADAQGQFAAMHARLMRSAFIPTPAYVAAIAEEMRIDAARMVSDMQSDAVTRALGRTAGLAARLGLRGTPSLVIGRTIVEGAVTRRELNALIEMHRDAEAAQHCPPRP